MNIKYKILVGLFLLQSISGCYLLEKVGISCGRFYEASTIEKVLADHAEAVRQIKNVNPAFIFVGAQEVEGCPGKAELLISFPAERDRQKIKQIIGDTFFGIRYRMVNT